MEPLNNSLDLHNLDFETLLSTAASLPLVRINRSNFLKSALGPHFESSIVEKAIEFSPAYAGIPVSEINKIAKTSINYETTKVSSLSFAAGIPGGFAILGTLPADLVQYMGHILRILQKLVYLYGWQDLFDGENQMDDETANLLTLFVGVMFGVNGAAGAIAKIADMAATHTAKKLAQKALTKGVIYPIVKKVAVALGAKMTKDIFAKGVSKMIPVLGGAASGGITYFTFHPMSVKLQKHLSSLKFADPNTYASTTNDDTIIDIESYHCDTTSENI